MSDKYGSTDNNWYSAEFQRYEREKAQEVLEKMKSLEAEFSKTREIVEEKTSFGGDDNPLCEEEMNLITLCSGIGAPELAASWLGWRHIMTCEIDPFCNRVLEYHYPEAYHHHDIKTLNYETIEKELFSRFGNWREGGTILVAGFPCQPFSCAGKRLGASDDRYLWDEVKRILAEIKPDWFIGENVAGILSMVLPGNEVKVGSYKDIAGESYEEIEVREQSVVERICLDLESIGYSVIPFVIPACAVGAPHRRDRVWFVANRTDAGIETQQREGKYGVLSCETTTHTDLDRQREWNGEQITIYERQGTPNDCPCGQDGAVADTPCHRNSGTSLETSRTPWRQDGDEIEQPFKRGEVRTSPDTTEQQGERCELEQREHGKPQQGELGGSRGQDGRERIVSDTYSKLPQRRDTCEPKRRDRKEKRTEPFDGPGSWENFPTQSPVCGGDDGLSFGLFGITFPKWRTESIKALGNSMVPQILYEIFLAIEQTHEQNTTENRQG